MQKISFLLLVVTLLSGCGETRQLGQVTGTVTLKGGKPLEFVTVEFWPDVGPTSRAKTDANGKYILRTTDVEDAEGAMVGSHKVSFKDMWPSKDDVLSDGGDWIDNSKGKKSRISAKYADPTKTPITVTVQSGSQEHNFELDPASR